MWCGTQILLWYVVWYTNTTLVCGVVHKYYSGMWCGTQILLWYVVWYTNTTLVCGVVHKYYSGMWCGTQILLWYVVWYTNTTLVCGVVHKYYSGMWCGTQNTFYQSRVIIFSSKKHQFCIYQKVTLLLYSLAQIAKFFWQTHKTLFYI